MFSSHNIVEIKHRFDGLQLTSMQPGDGEKKKSIAEGRWRKDRRGADRCAPLSWCWKATSEGEIFLGRGGLVAMEMTRNVLDAPGCPCRLMGPKPGPVPQWFCHSFPNPKCQLEYQKDWECWSIPERKTQHSPLLEWACGIAGCSDLPQAQQHLRATKKHLFVKSKTEIEEWPFLKKKVRPEGGKIP